MHPILVRADSAGATKAFLAELQERNIDFSVGFAIDASIRGLIEEHPDTDWLAAVNTDGSERHSSQ